MKLVRWLVIICVILLLVYWRVALLFVLAIHGRCSIARCRGNK